MAEIHDRPLKAISAALRADELRAHDLFERARERHDRHGEPLGAYKTWTPERARRAALTADSIFDAGGYLGPLHGIPVSVKDLYGVRGLDTFAGTARRLPPRWEREGPLVQALRRQWAVIMGKTHTVELAFGGLGVNHHWGTPRNPWDAQAHRVCGGSSSGAGVSLCEGSALVALGTDTAGSVRVPASMTGTVGLKTSAGRWSLEGIVPLSPTLDTPGVLTRSVADAAYAFAALDPAWDDAQALEDDLADVAAADLRIGLAPDSMWQECSPGVAEAVRAALEEVAAKGARLSEVRTAVIDEAITLFREGSVVCAECDTFLATELKDWRQSLDPTIMQRIADGGGITAREYLARQRQLRRLAAAASGCFAEVDAIALPTSPITPPLLEEVSTVEGYRPRNLLALRNTSVANMLGLCALTLPAGLDQAGMPVGLQLMARHRAEEHLLGVGLAFEKVLGTPQERLGIAPMCQG